MDIRGFRVVFGMDICNVHEHIWIKLEINVKQTSIAPKEAMGSHQKKP